MSAAPARCPHRRMIAAALAIRLAVTACARKDV